MNNHEAEQQLTEERKMLFAVETKINLLLHRYLRVEWQLALFGTQLAAMWLGKAKGALGIKTPYPQSFDPKSPVIENRADTTDAEGFPEDIDEVSAIKSLRAELNNIEKAIENDSMIMTDHKKYQLCIQNAYTHCCEATMWLGMSLNAIKKEQDKAALEHEESLNTIVKGEFTPTVAEPETDETGTSTEAAETTASDTNSTPGVPAPEHLKDEVPPTEPPPTAPTPPVVAPEKAKTSAPKKGQAKKEDKAN